MTFPSGDDQTIIWRIVAETEQASQKISQFKTNVASLKEELKKIQEVSKASFSQIATSIELNLKQAVDDAKAKIKELQAPLKQLEKAIAKRPPATSEAEKTTYTAQDTELGTKRAELEGVRQQLLLATQELKNFRQAKSDALAELKQEAKNAAVGITEITTALQTAGQVDAGAAQVTKLQQLSEKSQQTEEKIITLKSKIIDLKSELERLSGTGGEEFGPKIQMEQELTKSEMALQGLQKEFAETQAQIESFDKTAQESTQALASIGVSATQSAQQTASAMQIMGDSSTTLRQKIDAIKAIMVETQKRTGESFKVIGAEMKNAFKADITANINDFRERIHTAVAQLKELKATLALKSSTTTQDQLKAMEDEVRRLSALIVQLKANIQSLQQQQAQGNTALSQGTQELNNMTGSASGLSRVFGDLNSIASTFFGFTLASMAVQALRAIFGWLKDAADKARDFSQAMFQLEVGVRALRRSGIDITTNDILENLIRINAETGNLFSKLELVRGAADFTNLIRDLGLTTEQIFALQEAVIKLALVNGRSMDDVQRTVALALSSGYTEGLQRLGVSINRLTIAEEANRLGFQGGYTALSEFARAQATYNLLIRKSTKYGDDLSEAQKRLFGELQGTEAKIMDVKAAIGEAWLPVQLLLNQALLLFMKLLANVPFVGAIRSISALYTAVKALPAVWEEAGRKADNFIDKIKIILEFMKKLNDARRNLASFQPILAEYGGFGQDELELGTAEFSASQEKLADILAQYQDELLNLSTETAEKRVKIESDLQKDLQKITADGVKDRIDIERDYQADLDKLERDSAQRAIELAQDLQRRLDDIDLKLDFSVNEANIKYEFDVSETSIKFNEDVAKANEDFRQKELERERKYSEELLRLREDYLMELEDALENRDARAVLRARRELILAKERAKRENEENKIKNREALQEDITAAAQRRDARLRELKLELQMRLAELERQAQFDREEAQRRYEQDLTDLREKLRREQYERFIANMEQRTKQADDERAARTQRLLEYQTELNDLEAHKQAVLLKIGELLAQQATLMGMSYEEVKKVVDTYFGEDGEILGVIETFLSELERLIESFSASFSGVDASKFFDISIQQPKKPGAAKGGAAVATSPTDVTFGEVPELAIFAPLNQLDKLSGLFSNVNFGGGNKDGNIGIKVSLSPGLEAEIVEQSMDKIANIMFEVQRQ